MIGVWTIGPRFIGFPHVILAIASIPVLAMALVGLPHFLRDPLVRTIVVRATEHREAAVPARAPAVVFL